MAKEISNSDDYIDSRDVEERIEELEADESKTVWLFNYNMPGYMPDNEPEEYEDWDDAWSRFIELLEEFADDEEPESQLEQAYRTAAQTYQFESDREFGVVIGNYHFSVTEGQTEGLDEWDQEELDNLRKLRDQAEGYCDWKYGETLIRESAFTDYVEELCQDCGYISKDFPWWICIDWDETARNVADDYTTVDFAGVDYYIRS